jgi:hypothetical protein
LLTVHLSIFISLFNQLDAQNLFHSERAAADPQLDPNVFDAKSVELRNFSFANISLQRQLNNRFNIIFALGFLASASPTVPPLCHLKAISQ